MPNRYKGYSLLELMLVLVVAGIVMSAAFPAFQGMIARNRLATQTNDMILAISLARSEALRISGTYSVQAINGSNGNNEFGSGWCVVEGNPGDCDGVDDPGGADPRPIRRFQSLEGGTTLDAVDDVTSLQFNSLGALSAVSSRRLDLCHPTHGGRRIVVSMVGRVKAHRPDDPEATLQPNC